MALSVFILLSVFGAFPTEAAGTGGSLTEVAAELEQCTVRLEQAVRRHRDRVPYWLATADEEIRAVILGLPVRKETTASLLAQFREGRMDRAGGHLLANGLSDCRATLAHFKAQSLQFVWLSRIGLGVGGILTLCVVLAMFLPLGSRRSEHASPSPSRSKDSDNPPSASSSS